MASVSVIIPAYNQGQYLAQAVQSVLDQTFIDTEILIVDDGSRDNTADIARNIRDARVRYIYQENQGLSAARNTGIANSEATFITFLDSDDLFLPTKLEILVQALVDNPSAGFAAGQAFPIDENGKRVGKIFDTPLPDDPAQLLLGNPLHVGSILMVRSWLEKIGLFDVNLRSYEDWDMWLRLALEGCRMIWIPKPVSLYRFHQAQMTRIGKQMTTATFAVLDKLYQRPNLPDTWITLKSQAYSRAYLRAAAQAYLAEDFSSASNYIKQAVDHHPELLDDEGERLAQQFRSWTDLPKILDPIRYLKNIYEHLPSELVSLRLRKQQELGCVAMQLTFEAYRDKQYPLARKYALTALKIDPKLIGNRGLISIFGKSCFPAQHS